jgi:trimethylamine-N-oxide reductase (cytochrome c)
MEKLVRKTNSTTGGPVFVDVDENENKIVRVIPMDFTDNDAPSWKIEARGETFTPPRKTTYTAYTAGYKAMVHSNRRVLYPMKRVDFDPNGERNEEKRGESGYERISWDEALDIVSSEINRIKRTYGPGAIVAEPSSHHLWGNVGYRHSALFRFMNTVGIAYPDHNPDSWEGWHWGGIHTWGFSHRLGNPEQDDLLEDALKHTTMIVFWSSDPETNNASMPPMKAQSVGNAEKTGRKDGIHRSVLQPHSRPLFRQMVLSPCWNGCCPRGRHRICMAYEGLYDKEYVETHAFGFEEWTKYVLGESDGIPKTTEWAEEETGIPAHDIRALAREWAKNKTMLAAGGLGGWGGACRGATGMDWARMMIALITMQGLGKPGINMWSTTQGTPTDVDFFFPGYAEGGIAGDCDNSAAGLAFVYRMFGEHSRIAGSNINCPAGAHIPRLKIPECIMDGKFGPWYGKGFVGPAIEQQFKEYRYPENGYSTIKMYYKYGGPHIGTMGETNRYARMYRTKNLPIVVSQSIWFEGETPFADIILPACTNFERWDISEFANCSGYIPNSHGQTNHRVITFQMKCIEPLGESKSDYEIFRLLCQRLGVEGPFSEGKDELGWIKQDFHATDLPKYITWEEFTEKGYFVVPVDNKKPSAPAFRWFAEGREQDTPGWLSHIKPSDTVGMKGLKTQSGKVEFVSNSLKRFGHYDTDDKERPLMPMYLESWEGHHTERFKKYPIALVSPHPRFSFHTMGDGKDAFMNDIKDHRMLINGHYYWIIRINTQDAAARGIKEGDLVKAFNERGEVILAAQVTERVPRGTCHSYESSAEYQPLGTPGESPDRGGCVNILSPGRFLSKYASGMATEHSLIEIEKWEGGK